MNANEQKVWDSISNARNSANLAVSELNNQIEFLTTLRDSILSISTGLVPLLEKLTFAKNTGMVDNPTERTRNLSLAMVPLREATEQLQKTPVRIESGYELPPKPEPMWKTIERLMRGRGPFTGAEAGLALERELGRSLGPNRAQTVRNNLLRKT